MNGLLTEGAGSRDIRNVTAVGETGARFAATGTTTISNSILMGTGFDAAFDDGFTELTGRQLLVLRQRGA